MVTGQAPITLERKITSGGKEKNYQVENNIFKITETNRKFIPGRVLGLGLGLGLTANDQQTTTDVSYKNKSASYRYIVYLVRNIYNPNCKVTGAETEYPLAGCLLYTSPSPRDQRGSRMPSSA